MYDIKFSPAAEKYFKKLKEKPLKSAYNKALKEISENPYIGEQKKGDLSEMYGYDVKYNGINYEIAYTIHEINNKKVVIILVGTRENFYDELKRYIKNRT